MLTEPLIHEIKFFSSYVFTHDGSEITWRSARQTIIARSTMEFEVVALEIAESKAELLKNFLANIAL